MALATQCPHCHTTFRVAHDQLKLRAGLVRCGSCKQIFNGIENLLRTEDLEQPAPPLPSSVAPVGPADEAGTPETTEEALGMTPASGDEARDNPLLRMTLMDISPAQEKAAEPEPQDAGQDDALESAIDELQNKPWRAQNELPSDALDRAEAADYEEPAFVRHGRRRQRVDRALRLFMITASVILLFALLGQGAYVFRDRIATWFPQAKPVLAVACARLGCQVALPAQIDDVSIESSELQTLAANAGTFSLTVLLRNRSATAQAWPHIELTLNDTNEKAIARRVFAPREYLPATQDTAQGFGARSEQQVKLFFELAQLKASGYRVYLFYP
jgi:predicted Zn finger-like uncharacterized protein